MALSILTTQVPTSTNANDGSPINTGTRFTVAASRQCTHHRFWAPDVINPAHVYTGTLYQATSEDSTPGTGNVLAQVVYDTATLTPGWNSKPWPGGPVPIGPGIVYSTATHNTGGGYVHAAGVFTTAVVNGDLTAIADNTNPNPPLLGFFRNAAYDYGALTYPKSNGGGACYFADIVLDGNIDATLVATLPALTAALTVQVAANATLAGTLPPLSAALSGQLAVTATLAATLPALVAALTNVTESTPGTHTAGGNATTLTADGAAASTLTAAGTTASLTASGTP